MLLILAMFVMLLTIVMLLLFQVAHMNVEMLKDLWLLCQQCMYDTTFIDCNFRVLCLLLRLALICEGLLEFFLFELMIDSLNQLLLTHGFADEPETRQGFVCVRIKTRMCCLQSLCATISVCN